MSTLAHRFVLAGIPSEVPPARRQIVDRVRAWGVPLDEETADAIRLVASELITNAVVHGAGPITVTLLNRPGRLVIDVLDGDPSVRLSSRAGRACTNWTSASWRPTRVRTWPYRR
ncbi:ATP-binding protein [Streptomyces sp. enrichment culture]|uniref:ATP-binding protein n=1 Tax=Streptomyces sp. enrichment culture TaxID=1795815 RepID=UPI003F560B67